MPPPPPPPPPHCVLTQRENDRTNSLFPSPSLSFSLLFLFSSFSLSSSLYPFSIYLYLYFYLPFSPSFFFFFFSLSLFLSPCSFLHLLSLFVRSYLFSLNFRNITVNSGWTSWNESPAVFATRDYFSHYRYVRENVVLSFPRSYRKSIVVSTSTFLKRQNDVVSAKL